jgi:hypothetical protein
MRRNRICQQELQLYWVQSLKNVIEQRLNIRRLKVHTSSLWGQRRTINDSYCYRLLPTWVFWRFLHWRVLTCVQYLHIFTIDSAECRLPLCTQTAGFNDMDLRWFEYVFVISLFWLHSIFSHRYNAHWVGHIMPQQQHKHGKRTFRNLVCHRILIFELCVVAFAKYQTPCKNSNCCWANATDFFYWIW